MNKSGFSNAELGAYQSGYNAALKSGAPVANSLMRSYTSNNGTLREAYTEGYRHGLMEHHKSKNTMNKSGLSNAEIGAYQSGYNAALKSGAPVANSLMRSYTSNNGTLSSAYQDGYRHGLMKHNRNRNNTKKNHKGGRKMTKKNRN
jgi:hypothetical protein